MRPRSPAGTLAAMNPKVMLMIAATVCLALPVAACGSGSGGAPSAGASATTGLLAYAACVRSHGVPDFPDPASSGGIPKEGPAQLGVSDSQLEAAQSSCLHLLPGDSLSGQVSQPITTQQQDYLNAVACMRSHGIANFPDPDFSGGHVEFPDLAHIVDVHSTQFTQATEICRKLIPPGLPDSGSGG
jgi:hypothetical protein